MNEEITIRLFGQTYNEFDYLFFLIFAFLGLSIIKNIRYKFKKQQHIESGNVPEWKWSFKKWLDENVIDAILTFLLSFATLRFIGFWLNQIPLPEYVDVMIYGFLLGLFIQKVLHGIFQKVTVKKTIDKIKS